MKDFIKLIGNIELNQIIDTVGLSDTNKFKQIQEQFPEYDISFLWLLAYSKEDLPQKRTYLIDTYKKFANVLDSGFPKKLARKGNFSSRMWEIVLCDTLSKSGNLIPKGDAGADLWLKDTNDNIIQIEAVAPNEAAKKELRSERPDLSDGKIHTRGGNIEDLEYPIISRVLNKGFNSKENKYDKDKALIIAINSTKVVGMTSRDNYVLRRLLFGLGFEIISKKPDCSYVQGLQQNFYLGKTGDTNIELGMFRNDKYAHVSGVIYTSQQPIGFTPQGCSWQNYGITYVPNPHAKFPVELGFPYFRKIICSEEAYQELEPEKEFI